MEELLGGDKSLEYIRKIDGGGAGDVHQVQDLKNRRVFARKVFHSHMTNEVARNQVQLYEALLKRRHPNIVHVWKIGVLDGLQRVFMDMELCEKNLAMYNKERWADYSALQDGPSKIWDIIGQIVAGLKFLHNNGAVHRDLKPANVLLSRFNGQWQISDFDLTSLTGLGDEVQTELRRGTEGYRAPELVSNTQSKTIPVRYSLDIWAVGCILFELWHGKQAFVDDWSTREYYQTKDQFMDDGAFTTKSHVVFSDADDTIFWREIACLTQKEPDSRPKSEKVLERVREILGFKDVAVQTDPIIVNCPPRKMFAVEDSPETWIVTDAVVSSTKTHIVTGSYDKGRYRAQLWSIGQDARLWDILLHRPMKPVIPAFSQDGQYLVFSSGGALEVMDIENLRIIWNFEPSNPPAAICILNGGDRIAYSYNNPFSTTTSPQLIINISESQQASIASSKPVDVIQSVQMSDVSVAYDPDGHYLYAIGTPENDLQTLKGYVWDLNSNRRNYIKSLTFSSGDYRESPIRAFNLSDRLHLTVLSSTPTPQNNIRTILRVYTRKGTITHQFGCGWLIFTPLLEAVFILSVGKLLYHNRDRPKFEYGDYDEEPVRACQWCPVDGPARLSDRVEDYNATGPRLPLCLWKWNGRDEKPQWVGKLTTDVIDFEAVKAFVPYGDKVKLWLENGSCVSSSHIVFDAFRSVFRKKPERKPLD